MVEYRELDDALRRAGVSWNGAQSHGLLCGCLAVQGAAAHDEWLGRLNEPAASGASGPSSEDVLEAVYADTYRQLAERQSEFGPLLPDDSRPAPERAGALADWCEGFLHGLVSGPRPEALRKRLASEPLSEIIKDLLQITRASVEEEAGQEETETAYVELVEYVRVAAQLAYEELAEARTGQ